MKGKFVHVQAMKAYRGRRSIVPLILDLGARGQHDVRAVLSPGIKTVPIEQEAVGASRRFGEDKLWFLLGFEPRTLQPVA